jgi:AP-2 complex subunit alpha
MELAGEQVSDDIWHRLIVLVTNHKDLQQFAAAKLFGALQSKRANEALVKLGAYVLGEFGFLIAEEPGRSGEAQFALLMAHFPALTTTAQYQMLTAFVKMANLYEECRPLVAPVFARFKNHGVLELQQRALEYGALPTQGEEMMEDVLREMPAWNVDRASALELRVAAKDHTTADGNAWVKGKDKRGSNADKKLTDVGAASSAAGAAASGGAGAKAASAPKAAPADLLDMMDEPPPPPKAAAAPPPKPAAAAIPVAPVAAPQPAPAAPTPAPGAVVGIGAESIPAMRGWFNGLVVGAQGVLYEDAFVQVGFRHAYQQHQARLALVLKNKSSGDGGSWTEVRADIAPVPYLKCSVTGPLPGAIGQGESAQLVVAGECAEPFEACPECVVSFLHAGTGARHRYAQRLPVVATCFVEPVPLGASDFMARWGALGQAAAAAAAAAAAGAGGGGGGAAVDPFPKEQVVVFQRASGQPIDAAEVQRVKAAVLGSGLHLGPTTGLDDANPLQATAAGTFRTGSLGPNGQRVSVGVLVKLDASGASYRLTVRAVHGKVALALKNVIKAQLV